MVGVSVILIGDRQLTEAWRNTRSSAGVTVMHVFQICFLLLNLYSTLIQLITYIVFLTIAIVWFHVKVNGLFGSPETKPSIGNRLGGTA